MNYEYQHEGDVLILSHLFFQHFIEIEICMNKTIIHFVCMEHILFLASFLLHPITDDRSL